ncbi:hypothetical protein DB42_BR00070 [Neochlamydia sp. EPS4]|nr:hypothetical protein DB42_BR00070 [Neochlamydia sp. EPS4]
MSNLQKSSQQIFVYHLFFLNFHLQSSLLVSLKVFSEALFIRYSQGKELAH